MSQLIAALDWRLRYSPDVAQRVQPYQTSHPLVLSLSRTVDLQQAPINVLTLIHRWLPTRYSDGNILHADVVAALPPTRLVQQLRLGMNHLHQPRYTRAIQPADRVSWTPSRTYF
jgi:hypothetical protein